MFNVKSTMDILTLPPCIVLENVKEHVKNAFLADLSILYNPTYTVKKQASILFWPLQKISGKMRQKEVEKKIFTGKMLQDCERAFSRRSQSPGISI